MDLCAGHMAVVAFSSSNKVELRGGHIEACKGVRWSIFISLTV